MTGFNIGNFIGFRGNITPAKTDEIKEPKTGVTLPPALEKDTFVKSVPQETPKAEEYDDDYDEEYEKEQAKWLQERLEALEQSAQKLETLSLSELQNTLDIKFSLEYDAPDAEPSYKTLVDTIISKIDKNNINSKDTADMLRFILTGTQNLEDNTEEELSRIIAHASALLHEAGKESYQANFDTLQEAFKDTGTKFSGRVKTAESIKGKMPLTIASNLKKCDNLFNAASDICGYRLVTNGSDEQSEKIIAQIEKLIEDGTYTPFLISSHGENPYISRDEILRLYDEKGFNYAIKPYPGFTGTNIVLKDKEGKKIELQIIGKEVNKVNIKEHKFYKLWAMSPEEHLKYFKSRHSIDAYDEYVSACYAYARNLEQGLEDKKPELPEGLSEDLRLI